MGADALGRYHSRGRSPVWSCVTPARLVTFLRRSMGEVRPTPPPGEPIDPRAGLSISTAQATTPGTDAPGS
jgi:hypothetical protein